MTGRVDIHRHPYTTAACAAGVVTKTTDRDSLRFTYNGTRRVRQLALGCRRVKSTHGAYENTWKCGELKLYFSPSAGGYNNKKKKWFALCVFPGVFFHSTDRVLGTFPVTTDLNMRVNVRQT